MSADGTAPPSLVGPETIAAMCKLASATPRGCFVEVGVYQGGTAWHLDRLANQQRRRFYAYDTFTGIPYSQDGDSHRVGDFGNTSYEAVRAALMHAYIVVGVFPGSAVPMDPIAFVHLDCDQYQSYTDALEYLGPLIVPGGFVWCDDVPCLPSAARAINEYASRHGRRVSVAEKAVIHF